MEIVFDTHDNAKQKQCATLWHNDVTEEIVYGGSKGSGKSYLGCSLIFMSAFAYPETHYFISRKTLNDLRKFTIPSIHEVFKHWGIPESMWNFNAQDNVFTLNNGSKIFLLDAKDMPSDPHFERFGSLQMTGGWIEEAGEFSRDAKNNLSASIGRWKNEEYGITGKLLMTCNPSKNFLYTDFYKPFKDRLLDKTKAFVQALPKDNKMLSKGYLERLSRTLTSEQKQRLLKGNWEYDDDPTAMIGFDAISDLFSNAVEEGHKFCVIDVARQGKDKTKITLWEGLNCFKVIVIDKMGLDMQGDKVKQILEQYKIPRSRTIIDEDGIGGGLVDILRGVKGFMANTTAIQEYGSSVESPQYENLKAQCAYLLAEKVNNRHMSVDFDNQTEKDLLIEELQQLKTRDADKEGKMKIVRKDQIKENIGRSPDILDCFIMRMFFEIKKPSSGLRVTVL